MQPIGGYMTNSRGTLVAELARKQMKHYSLLIINKIIFNK